MHAAPGTQQDLIISATPNTVIAGYLDSVWELYSQLLTLVNAGIIGQADTDYINTLLQEVDAQTDGYNAAIQDPASLEGCDQALSVLSELIPELEPKLSAYKTLQVSQDPSFAVPTSYESVERSASYVQAHPDLMTAYNRQEAIATASAPSITKYAPWVLGAAALYFAFKG
jgi:hypothetical protein